MEELFDIAIIGSGPAGLSAALNAKIRNKKILFLGKKELSEKLYKAHTINNYLGFPSISGQDLKNSFKKHIDSLEIEIMDMFADTVYSMGDYFSISVKEKVFDAKTVIVAVGMDFPKTIKGEREYLGKGVSYCATCDAMLFRNKKVAVIAYDKEDEAEALYLSEIGCEVYYIPMYKETPKLSDRIKIINEKPLEISGSNFLSALITDQRSIEVSGVFVLKQMKPVQDLIPGVETADGHIVVDRSMQTSIPGLFAAGDCTGKPYQYMKAAGEGLVASLSAVAYLDKLNKNKV
ncbi:MAG TPA: NAD(P)/FAD-dependent oxidoreductase [Petrotogaceae bacterium]|jgi:thioredoxin reductase (NADPH)|nr:NAD(P)/FAD-dependent oxidoreductase [Petrotogaceae bacterium]HOG33978.1 NAD(P)/FAD-dependent oxidoreductase [Petrotogaceae bacterium]HPA92323.1 NAD(P)/FAD-dependent oxidoreductase [Petrotogaceae bacterium]HPG48663.1 NAD(P)/FAD-dependent oxidoreductase [Petrotogaceae bacterium]HPO26973.1 NAD(P)/FAD-dependent oxidoreductase [Petrotogaceae bacterium]